MSVSRQGTASAKALFASLIGSMTSILLFRLPFWPGPMYGDDYLLVNGARQPVDSSGVVGDFFLVGGGKWRPLNTPLLLFLARRFGFEYRPYQIVNLALLVICCTVVGLMVWLVSRSLLATLLSSACVGASSFTWLGQVSVYGVLEFSAILVALSAVAVELRAFLKSQSSGNQSFVAVGLVAAATFIHERMLVLTFLFGVFHLFKQRRLHISLAYFSVPIIHVALKGFFFQLDASQSGGESNLQQVAGLWIVRHLLDGVGAIFGMNSGAGIFYSDGTIPRLARAADLGFVGAVPVITVYLILVSLVARETKSSQIYETIRLPSLILVLAVGTTIPAALVIQRIEGRWLFFPQTLFVLSLFTSIFTLSQGTRTVNWRIPLCVLLAIAILAPSIYYRSHSRAFTFIRDQPSLMISDVSRLAPKTGAWVLVLGNLDATIPFQWQTGYMRAFEQLPNPPFKTEWGDSSSHCPKMDVPTPCVIAVSGNGNLRARIDVLYTPSNESAYGDDAQHKGD